MTATHQGKNESAVGRCEPFDLVIQQSGADYQLIRTDSADTLEV